MGGGDHESLLGPCEKIGTWHKNTVPVKRSASADRTQYDARIATTLVRDSFNMVIPRRWEPPANLIHHTAVLPYIKKKLARAMFHRRVIMRVMLMVKHRASYGWMRFAGGSQRRGMSILKPSLTGVVAIRASYWVLSAEPLVWSSYRGRSTGFLPPYARTRELLPLFFVYFFVWPSDFQVSKTIFDSREILFLELLLLFWSSCYFLELLLGSSIWWRELGETPSAS